MDWKSTITWFVTQDCKSSGAESQLLWQWYRFVDRHDSILFEKGFQNNAPHVNIFAGPKLTYDLSKKFAVFGSIGGLIELWNKASTGFDYNVQPGIFVNAGISYKLFSSQKD
ncbi:MAG: hypothetical protein MK078_12625 [Crocinitomicaceae bacterium]|nr:hypothetical protein [Crocinitomicaceae bacterium]